MAPTFKTTLRRLGCLLFGIVQRNELNSSNRIQGHERIMTDDASLFHFSDVCLVEFHE